MSATEKRSRQLTAREGQKIGDTRDMAGQAPYIVNTGIAYSDFNTGWEAGIYYNVQGPTLNMVGFGNRTDTYAVPFNSLNLNVTRLSVQTSASVPVLGYKTYSMTSANLSSVPTVLRISFSPNWLQACVSTLV
jgi:hypothetical protein